VQIFRQKYPFSCVFEKKAVPLRTKNRNFMNVIERITALRGMMRNAGLEAYVVPGNDPHASEYMASHWCEMQWLSGFNGESGTVVVTLDKAFLWTDSRYYLQAGIELRDSTI
jgi:Xaa-Pro aminopeptidase